LAPRLVPSVFDVAAFGVELSPVKADHHIRRLDPRIQAYSGVALFLRVVEVPAHAGHLIE